MHEPHGYMCLAALSPLANFAKGREFLEWLYTWSRARSGWGSSPAGLHGAESSLRPFGKRTVLVARCICWQQDQLAYPRHLTARNFKTIGGAISNSIWCCIGVVIRTRFERRCLYSIIPHLADGLIAMASISTLGWCLVAWVLVWFLFAIDFELDIAIATESKTCGFISLGWLFDRHGIY